MMQTLRSVSVTRDGQTVILDDADRHVTVRVRFKAPHAIPQIDAMRPGFVLKTYLDGGTGALRPRFTHATVGVR